MLELDRGNRIPIRRFVLRLPLSLNARVSVAGRTISAPATGEFILPPGTRRAEVDFMRKNTEVFHISS